ncbi:MAG: gliding motility-associated C-terminal domain-containing protein [Saprospiraceae bacterium]
MKKILLFILCLSLTLTRLTAQCGYTVSVNTANTFLCNPAPVQLNTSTTGSIPVNAIYEWTPTIGLNNPASPNPIATPNSTTTYTYSVSTPIGGNLITNGDFELGNTGFTTGHTPGTGGTWGLVSNNGTYAVTTNPNSVHSNFASCGDHTPTGTNMLVLNCSSTPNTSMWCQTVTVTPNTNYVFSYWAISTVSGSPAQVFVEANGTSISGVTTLSSTTCQWQEISFIWNSGSLTSANFCIMNQNLAQSGNDTGLDDISLVQMCNESDNVTITINNSSATSLTASTCVGDSLFIGGAWQTQAGFYNDTLTTWNGCDSILTTQLSLTSYTSFVNTIICAGDSVFLQNAWQTQNGFYNDTLQSVVDGCDSIVVTELNLITYSSNRSTSICVGDSVFLQNAWQTQAGTYFDTLTSTDGCDSIVTTLLSLIPGTPPTLGDDVSICEGDSIMLSSSLIDVFFLWNNGSTNNNITVKNTGDYILTTTNPSGCKASDTISITVVPLPDIVFANDTTICDGESVEITTIGIASMNYLWQDGSTNSSFTATTSGTYYLTLTDASVGCMSNDSITLVPVPLPLVDLGDDVTICTGEEITINAFDGNNRSYQWSDGSTGAAIVVNSAGTYSVTVTENGCSSEDEMIVLEETCECITAMPNAFSPNNDGSNDYIFPIIQDGCEFTNFRFIVFSRWGQIVYETNSATPSDLGWNGEINGTKLPQDTYVWIMEYKTPLDSNPIIKKGEILLVR